MYDLAIEANNNGDHFPIWGSCLGFQFLLYLVERVNHLVPCRAYDKSLPLDFTPGFNIISITIKNYQFHSFFKIKTPDATTSRLYGSAPASVLKTLTENTTAHFHNYGVTPEVMASTSLHTFYKTLATSIVENGTVSVSTIEAYNYPFWGNQFHPEKNEYEWGAYYPSIDHSSDAVRASIYFADFFVSEGNND